MQESDFDRCPSCGSFGVYGLRCHPKFSTCYETTGADGFLDLGMAYFHSQHENDSFAEITGAKVLYKQKWNPDSAGKTGWEEYQ